MFSSNTSSKKNIVFQDWVEQPGSPTNIFRGGMAASDSGQIIYLPGNTKIRKSTDGGVTWTTLSNSPNLATTICCSSDGSYVGAGYDGDAVGTYYYSSDSGSTWNTVSVTSPLGGTAKVKQVSCSSTGSKVVIAGESNIGGSGGEEYIYYSSNSGATFTAQTTPGRLNWVCCSISDDGTKIYVSGTASSVLNPAIWVGTVSGSVTWVQKTSGLATSAGYLYPFGVTCSSNGSKVVFTYGSSASAAPIYISSNSGDTWTNTSYTVPSATDVTNYAISSDGNTILAVSNNSNPMFTTDFFTSRQIIYTINGVSSNRDWRAGCAMKSDGTYLVMATTNFSGTTPNKVFTSP